jgi:hypothetical protein
MWISHEAIYQALYIRGRGALQRELTTCLRTGCALRMPPSSCSSSIGPASSPPVAGDEGQFAWWQVTPPIVFTRSIAIGCAVPARDVLVQG